MKKLFLPLLAAALLASPVQSAQVTNLIDNFTTSQ